MAISVATPKNLRQIHTKFIGGFTKRQVFSIGAAAAVGFPFYFAIKPVVGTDTAAILMVVIMMPFLLFMSENLRYGLPAEKLLMLMWQHNRTPKIRPYKAQNLFRELEEREKIKKEVLYLEEKARSGRRSKGHSKDNESGK